jgi:hypothetical protein
VILVILVFGSWPGSKLDRFTDRVWYSVIEDTDWNNVHIERRSSDCDFLHAPLGSKGCEYKKATMIFGLKERRKLVAEANTPEDRASASQQPNTVVVYWEKKEQP